MRTVVDTKSLVIAVASGQKADIPRGEARIKLCIKTHFCLFWMMRWWLIREDGKDGKVMAFGGPDSSSNIVDDCFSCQYFARNVFPCIFRGTPVKLKARVHVTI